MLVRVFGYLSLILLLANMVTGGLLIQKNGQVNVLKLNKLHNEFVIAQMVETIQDQNSAVEKYRVDLEEAETRWKNREPSVKVVERWKTEYVKDENATCQTYIDNMRIHGF